MYFPNRDELSLRIVLALPNAGRQIIETILDADALKY